MKRARFHKDARAELREAAAYYESEREGLATEFLAEVDRTIQFIRNFPMAGSPYERTRFRSLTIRRFPFIVYYLDLPDAIWIVAVAHGKRRPGYWRSRRFPVDRGGETPPEAQ